MSDPRAWLAGRTPRPPDALSLPIEDGDGTVGDRLTDAARAALDRALAERGERRGAFELLAADALLTYACEFASGRHPEGGETPDPDAELLRILDRLARRSG